MIQADTTISEQAMMGDIQLYVQVQKFASSKSSADKISNCYGRMDVRHNTWHVRRLKSVLDENQTNLTALKLRHVQIYI